MSASTLDGRPCAVERKRRLHRRKVHAFLRAAVADDGEPRRQRGDPDDLFVKDSPGRHHAARSANFAYRLRKESLSISVGPLRCLARMTSASPCWSVSSL